ncbi:hypothetical protein CR513_39767, partial [Mucuna pruriens]
MEGLKNYILSNGMLFVSPKGLVVSGLHLMRGVNDAYMQKLAWELCTCKDKFWARVLRGKYKCGEQIKPPMNSSKTTSTCWRGISSLWKAFCEAVIWQIDNWAAVVGVVSDFALRPLHESDLKKKKKWWTLPQVEDNESNIIHHIRALIPPCPNNDDDILIWKNS